MSGKQHVRGSLRLKLMLWLAIPGLAVLGVSALLSYRSASSQATTLTDRQLISSARMIAEQIDYAGGYAVSIPPAALELFASDSHDEVAYAVFDPHGLLIAGYPGLNPPASVTPDFEFRFFHAMFRTESMRATELRQPIMTPSGPRSVSVLVGETLKAHDQMIRRLWLRGFLEEAALIFATMVSIWIGINRELRPLLSLRRAVLDRPSDRFEPFDSMSVQTELRPLVLALNSHMQRLQRQLLRQRRFLDSAAHQLRTPLAIMKTQVGYALRTRKKEDVVTTLERIDDSLTAMGRLTNQLLALGEVEHDRAAQLREQVDLTSIIRGVVAESAPRGLDHGVELVFESNGPAEVLATGTLARELARNLVDNAIRYAGPGSTATVSVLKLERTAQIRVDDNGAGIEAEDRLRLTRRFSRGRRATLGGSGLGLSIVAEIAETFGGSLELPSPAEGNGFSAVVALPLAPDRKTP